MKTIVIWDQVGEDQIRFFVLEGDFSRLNRIYINTYFGRDKTSEEKAEELNEIVYDANGKCRVSLLDSFPVELVEKDTIVISAGFFP